MDWPRHVRVQFDKYVKSHEKVNPELLKSLETHPKVTRFITMLSEEISKAERMVHKRRGKPLRIDTINWFIKDMTNLLIRGINNEADRRVESFMSALKRKEEQDYYNDLDETVNGNPSGVFEDLDIQIGETKETTEKRFITDEQGNN